MATHSSVLAWRIPGTEEPWRGPWDGKEVYTAEATEHSPLTNRMRSSFSSVQSLSRVRLLATP